MDIIKFLWKSFDDTYSCIIENQQTICHCFYCIQTKDKQKFCLESISRHHFGSEGIIEKKIVRRCIWPGGCVWQSGHIATWTIYILRDTFTELAIDSGLIDWDMKAILFFQCSAPFHQPFRTELFFYWYWKFYECLTPFCPRTNYTLPLAFCEINWVTLVKDYWLNYVKTCCARRQRWN